MKLKKNNTIIKIIYKVFVMCFSVLLTVFSMFIVNIPTNIEKTANNLTPYSQNVIIQTPKENRSWAYRFKGDMNSYHGKPLSLTDTLFIKEPFNTKIFMSKYDLLNRNFTQSELRGMVEFASPAFKNLWSQWNNAKIHITKLKLNRSRKTISIDGIGVSNIGTSLGNTLLRMAIGSDDKYEVPIQIINFDYLLEGSIMSSSHIKHLPNGETRYHSKKPVTRIKWSEDFIKSLYFANGVQTIIDRLKYDDWGFISSDYNLAVSKAKSMAINEENYDQIKLAYKNSHSSTLLMDLKIDPKINKYIVENDLKADSLHYYFYLLKKSRIKFEYGSNAFSTVDKSFVDLLNGINLTLSDVDTKAMKSNRTNWEMHIKNLTVIPGRYSQQIEGSSNPNISFHHQKFDIPNDKLSNYDLDLKYSDITKTELVHRYLFQTHGLDISKNISFFMEDGTMLNQDFIVTKASSNNGLKVGDAAYVAIRYWITHSSGQKEYVTLKKKINPQTNLSTWFSPKYNNSVIAIDPSFDPKKLEYLFNQDLQLIINPYQSSPISSSTPQSFALKTVKDITSTGTKVLEDWTDGKWSHTTQNGKALFDGVFGTDINGRFDSKGRLTSGKHNIVVELQNQSFKGLRNNFHITIDKNPVVAKVSATEDAVKKFFIRDTKNKVKEIYYSSGPIKIEVSDFDIKSVDAKFIDGDGNWYYIPIQITSKFISGTWKQFLSSTIDYAGFAKVTIIDRADNSKTFFFWLKQRGSTESPDLDFSKKELFDDVKRTFQRGDLSILNSPIKMKISSPLVTNMEVQKLSKSGGNWNKENNNNDFAITSYSPGSNQNNEFGRTIDSSNQVLKFAGDELKPFVKKGQTTWPTTNRIITFNNPGLYLITLHSRIIGKEIIQKYVYVKDNKIKILDENNLIQEEGNFKDLPTINKGPLTSHKDTNHKATSEMFLDIPTFLIKEYKVAYSQLWYSQFNWIKYPSHNFTKEGKYKIYITDIYGVKYYREILVINKKITTIQREKQNLNLIYGKDKDESTAFWKGKVKWNYWRYEDVDHAKWEHDDFIKKAIKSGLSKKEAEAIFRHLKKNPGWNWGDARNVGGKPFDPKKAFNEWRRETFNLSGSKRLSKSSLAGIIVGSILGVSLIVGSTSWFAYKHIKGRRIK